MNLSNIKLDFVSWEDENSPKMSSWIVKLMEKKEKIVTCEEMRLQFYTTCFGMNLWNKQTNCDKIMLLWHKQT